MCQQNNFEVSVIKASKPGASRFRDHSSITSANRWVDGDRDGNFC